MRLVYIITLLCSTLPAMAQLTREQRIQDSVIGWDPKNIYDELKPQTGGVARQKEANMNKMAAFIKKSYTPVGGLGEYQRFINTNSYHVLFHIWDVGYDYLDAQKHFRPIGETGSPRFYLSANSLPGSWNIDFMCKPDRWIFTMQPDGYSPNSTEEKHRAGSDPRISPLVHPYLTWRNDWYTVYLTPGNKLPMTRMTKGEFLQTALQSLDGVKGSDVDQYKANIRSLLQKYQHALDEPATLKSWQWHYRDITVGSLDVFTGGPNTMYYPVYTIDAATIEKTRGAQPLWIAISFPFEKPTDGNKNYEMYAAMTQHLNYEYVYNYFFDSAKVKGKSYTPIDEAGLNASLEGFRTRNRHNLTATEDTRGWAANTHFQENFETAAEGAEPLNWSISRHDELDNVVTLKEYPGKWLQLGYNNNTMPTLMRRPLPRDFSLEFDLVTAPFSGAYGGSLRLYLSTNKAAPNGNEQSTQHAATIGIDITAGNEADYNNNNYRGSIRTQLLRLPEVNEQNFVKGAKAEYPLREFTDRKRNIHVMLEVTDGKFQLSINGKPVIASKDMLLTYGGKCPDCTIPADLGFNYIQWRSTQSGIATYIGNIRIIKK